ncbi:MAG: hypothetical protein OXC19_16365 [Bryobacterales bacterium]|nr:hypothetical protein [Bryobacterales bacterium]
MTKAPVVSALRATQASWAHRVKACDIVDHPTARGDVAERAWRDLLRTYLPGNYRVADGFVISCDGLRSDQIDCVIFDNTFTPLLFGGHGVNYIPAEAVYAVLEVKPKVDRPNILYSSRKIESVRRLRRTSAPYVGDGAPKPPKPSRAIIGGLMARTVKRWANHVRTLNELSTSPNAERALDLVLTVEGGSLDYFDSGHPSNEPTIHTPGTGLIRGVLRMTQALQTQGTVPAIDWKEWLARFSDAEAQGPV